MKKSKKSLTEKDYHMEFDNKCKIENDFDCVESHRYEIDPYQFRALVFLGVKRFTAKPLCNLKKRKEIWMWVSGIAGGLLPIEVNATTKTSVDSLRFHWKKGAKTNKGAELDMTMDFLPRANEKKIQRLAREPVKVTFLSKTENGQIGIETSIKPTRMPPDIHSAVLPITFEFA